MRPIRGSAMSERTAEPALVVENLTTEFRIGGTWYPAVRGVGFALGRNETLALVGESGCGKSITALSIIGLVPKANGRVTSGRVMLDGPKGGDRMGMSFTPANPGGVAPSADRVAVLYPGDIVQLAGVEELFAHPTPPYTEALLRSIPRVGRDALDLKPIPGQVPPITAMPAGCRYADRCPLRIPRCSVEVPPLVPVPGLHGHQARCWVRAGDGAGAEAA